MSPFKDAARELLRELEEGRLCVCKVKTEHGYVRMPVSQNAEWYQRLCRRHLGSRRRYRKVRTIIKRCWMVRALRRLLSGGGRDRIRAAIGAVCP